MSPNPTQRIAPQEIDRILAGCARAVRLDDGRRPQVRLIDEAWNLYLLSPAVPHETVWPVLSSAGRDAGLPDEEIRDCLKAGQLLATGGDGGDGDSAPLVGDDDPKPTPAELGRAFLADHTVRFMFGDLWIYRDGVYQTGGEAAARAWVQTALGKRARKRDGDETIYWLKTATRVDAATVDSCDLVNVANGLLDWQTGDLRPHGADVVTTVQLPASWAPDAYHERLNRFLDEVLPDRETRAVLEEFAGYCLLPDCRFQKALMLTGDGSNGKSVLLHCMKAFLGAQNVSDIRLQDLDDKFRLAGLVGKLANICADLPRATPRDSGIFKLLVAGDDLTAERKYQAPFSFRNRAKQIFSANELPGTSDRSGAYFRRWIIIPFQRRFSPDQPAFDPQLADKLTTPAARAYFLRLAVQGLRRLIQRGHFADAPATRTALEEYRRDADEIREFFEERCEFVGGDAWISQDEIYGEFSAWCESGRLPVVSKRVFNARLRTIQPGLTEVRRGSRGGQRRVWNGLQLQRRSRLAVVADGDRDYGAPSGKPGFAC